VAVSDVLGSARLWLWFEGLFDRLGPIAGREKLAEPVWEFLWQALTPAA
jgi:hypothetical protein